MSELGPTLVLHSISLSLCIPLVYSQYKLNNILLLFFSLILFLFHTVNTWSLAIYGSKMPNTVPTPTCLLRKALVVYAQQAVYLLSAMVSIRLWMIVSGRDAKHKERVPKIEWMLAMVGVLVPAIPALLVSVPQLIVGIQYVPEDFKLFRCSQGYLYRWQLIAAGLVFTVTSFVIAFACLNVIIYHIVRLLRNANINKEQRKAALFMALRVFVLCVAVYVNALYYIVADYMRFNRKNMVFWNPVKAKNENFFGHILISMWGILYFLAFGTTTQSRKVIMALFGCGSGDQEMVETKKKKKNKDKQYGHL